MTVRLETGGRRIDRARSLRFSFDGRLMRGFAGDTLASALMGAGQRLVGRSFKYHRPRGLLASGAEEPNALVGLGRGARFEPNQRATTTALFDGLEAVSQNRWPSLETDIGAVNDRLARFLPAGFYYKTFIHPRPFWKHLFEPVIRRSAGLGRAPDPETVDADRYEHLHWHCDVMVVGAGLAGLAAARDFGRAGLRVLLVEQGPEPFGGRAPVDGVAVDGGSADAFSAAVLAELRAMPHVVVRANTMAAGVYDHGYVLALERVADDRPGLDAPRHRLWRVRTRHVVVAAGALERPLAFAGNDRPGVMLASAVRDYLVDHAVAPGRRTVVVTNNDDAYRTAIALVRAGLDVPCVVDARDAATGPLPDEARALGIPVRTGMAIATVQGGRAVEGVTLCRHAGEGASVETLACDAVAMSGGWSPAVHLWSHCGGKLVWDEAGAFFRPDPAHPPTGADGAPMVTCIGAADGVLEARGFFEAVSTSARKVLESLAKSPDGRSLPVAEAPAEHPLLPVWVMPAKAGPALRAKMWLDFQNDVKVSDVELAAREGYASVEHTKRYTTLGMATDQGKLSNINGLAVLAAALDKAVPQVGTTTFRPPYTPVSMGAIAGEARGALFQPLRRTPIDDWHAGNGAVWEPVGQWRRPYAYPRGTETAAQAVLREVRAVRGGVGLLDASTLGKILVSGPDAGRFLDMLYTNAMAGLAPGRCRYGLMCTENGFLFDDGVVARLDEQSFLVHTTSGGADRVHAWMEDWLQCEWWDWKVHTVNLTEQFAQIAVVGPLARTLLQRLGGSLDLSASALPFMGWAEGTLAGFDARVFRISFSGELSYEVAVAASQGGALWRALIEAGALLGVTPYGTEALHVMRAEKGFIMIGDETDGTVTPRDLGLDWAISRKKADFLGKRGMERTHLADPDRWALVGLRTLDGSVLADGAYVVDAGHNANGQRNTQGRVTSRYYSPTLNRGIAMALVRRGPSRMGEVVQVTTDSGGVQDARIVPLVQYDPEGRRQDV